MQARPFEMYYVVNLVTGCWEWRAGCGGGGYGCFRKRAAHRFAYEREYGPIPEGLVMDHLCRNRKCVNPKHLEAVTNAENVLRGASPSARIHVSGRCIRGHLMEGDNVMPRSRGGVRQCRICSNWRARRYEQRKRGLPLEPEPIDWEWMHPLGADLA